MLIAVDFGELNPPAALVFTDNQQRTCANITIIDDNIVEGPETFSVTLSSTNFQVDVLSSNVPVFIADNEGKITRIKFDVKIMTNLTHALQLLSMPTEALFEFTQNVYIGLEGTTFPFAIRLASESGVLSQPVTMMVISGDGSALGIKKLHQC